ncbi:S8 family serine peptidase [Bacillus sp. UNCCL81]|uniref:S8 family serine peptidase n=1 Tax=Bacillus sp. UNCCL81 TaxID=1502755 RepID=UPI0008E6C724|nr:S8 family serine peptidase [Bacillus sp. UNCCL81]SFD48852.1 Subtilisin-like serine proteases [Bacillus sp. UNCCL81]
MLKRTGNSKLVKGLSVAVLSSSFVLGSLGHVSNITKAENASTAESILAKLTPQQREALQKLSSTDQSGLFLDSSVNINSPETVSVIVSFKQKPQKIAVLEAALKGEALSEEKAKINANADHSMFKEDLSSLFKTKADGDYKIKREYKHAFNGVALEVPANKLQKLMKSTAVQAIYSDATVKSELPVEGKEATSNSTGKGMADERTYLKIDKLHQEGYTGKGVKVAVLDTGIDYNHPDIKEAFKGGYDFVDNDNDPMETSYADWVKAGKPGGTSGAASYVTEHGTHVSGAIVGQGKNESEYATTGIAPDADLYVYRVLGPGGSGTTENIIAGIDQAVADGMDVMNLSLGANYNDPLLAESIAINNAVLSGVTAVVAAGNTGNKMYTLGSPGTAALALTVGASDVPITTMSAKGSMDNVSANLQLMANGYGDDITKLKGQTLPVVDVNLGEAYTGKDVKGKIVLMSRGTYTLDSKIAVAKSQGAVAVLMYNDNPTEGFIPSYLGEGVNFIPSFSLSNAEGLALKQKLQSGSANFTISDMSEVKTQGDTIADFSSRGPARLTYDIKPEITAPGVSVLSTVPGFINNPDNPTDYKNAYQRMSGTSMATPFTTGVAALLKQANHSLQPEDIKAILMNSADSLSKPYSVFEQGAGRIDPYNAIHSSIEIKVQEKTPMIVNGKEKQINEDTGALSFGNVAFDGKDYSDSRSVTLMNRGEKTKTFDVKVNFQSNLRGSKDAVANGVTVQSPASVTLKGISQKKTNITLNIPKTAEKGIYEGYVVYTNKDNPSETYRVPFGVHFVEKGFQDLSITRQAMTTDRNNLNSPLFNPFLSAKFSLKSHMRYIDVVLTDAVTGQDLGIMNTFDGVSFDEGVQYTISAGQGVYYPFTNDVNNPISSKAALAKEGLYKVKLIGYDDAGNSYTISQDLLVDTTMPNQFDIHVEGEKEGSPFIEYKEDQKSIPYTAKITDKSVEIMNAAGIKADQSTNTIGYFYNSPFMGGKLELDENGNAAKDEIEMVPSLATSSLRFIGGDLASNAFGDKQYYFVKEGTQYVYGQPNAKTRLNKLITHPGETNTITLTANNVSKLKQALYSFTTNIADTNIVGITLNPAAAKLGGQLNVTTTNPSSTTVKSDVNVTFDGSKEVSGDLPMVDVTIKIPDMKDVYTTSSFRTVTSTFTSVDNVITKPFTYIAPISILPSFSSVISYIHPESFQNADGTLKKADYTKIGANVTIVDSKGKSYTGTMDSIGQFYITGLPVTKDEFTVITDIPGHFNTYGKFDRVYNTMDGFMYGIGKRIGTETVDKATAGDINKDNVIDLNDALAIETYWGTNKRSADINFDGTVDAKDFAFVEKNYLMQNPAVDNAPKPVKNSKGKTIDTIKSELGIQ